MLRSHRPRRRDPVPVVRGPELLLLLALLGLIVLGLIVLSLAALTGRAMTSAAVGGGWVWPTGSTDLGRGIGGLLVGEPRRGLPPAQAAQVAAPGAVYAGVVVCEVLVIAAAIAVAVAVTRFRHGEGMASRHDAREVLGVGQLRRNRSLIRPDLYGRTDQETVGKVVRRWR